MKRRQPALPKKRDVARLPKIGESTQPTRHAPTPPVYVKSSECKRKRGMVVEPDKILQITEETSILEATEAVYRRITDFWIKGVIETDKDEIQSFYIGKSFIDRIPGKEENFSLDRVDAWNLKDGIRARYSHHSGKEHCLNSLIVVAVATDTCIPSDMKSSGWCLDNEEFALLLERHLVRRFLDSENQKRLANRSSTDPNKMSITAHAASVIYMTFSLKGKGAGAEAMSNSSIPGFKPLTLHGDEGHNEGEDDEDTEDSDS